MPTIITELNISCVWGGTLTGVLLKNDVAITSKFAPKTMKIICIHGWLDNLNSFLPVVEKLIEHQPNYEIYLYDRAGHGFSSHYPKGLDYSDTYDLQDLRTIIQTLGWNNENFSIIGHSYGAILGTIYAASYPEVLCFVAIDSLLRQYAPSELFWKSIATRIDKKLITFSRTPKIYNDELTFEKAVEVTKNMRPGISDEAAKLLTERSVRRDKDNQLHFTRDKSLQMLSLYPYTNDMVQNAVISIKASVLFIGSSNDYWSNPYGEPYQTIDLLKQYNPNFELTWLDGPHHLHMTRADAVADRIQQYFDKYFQQSLTTVIENSKL